MAFEHREPYVTDVENYTVRMDRVSPYHKVLAYYRRLWGGGDGYAGFLTRTR